MPSTNEDRRPDLVLVMTDQQRYDQVGYAHDGPLRTPNLDRLAAAGITFDQAYSASTTCVPSRTSLMTGLLDHRTPHTERWMVEEGFFTVPHALAGAGYQTALIGKMHFNPMRTAHGFEHMRVCEHLNAYRTPPGEQAELDHYHDWLRAEGMADWRFETGQENDPVYPLDPSTHPTAWVERETVRFLDEHRDRDRPLFLVISFPHPHPPVNPPEPYASMYDPAACEMDPAWAEANRRLPTQFRTATAQEDASHRRVRADRLDLQRADLARSYGLITQIDDAVGRLTDRLDLDGTVVFFTSDHGDYGGRRGLVRKIPWIPFDDLARVPFFVTGGPVAGGRRTDALVQSFDLATTCLDLARVEVDLDVFDGVSLARLLADPTAEPDPDRTVVSALTMGWPMVRRGPHKYIRSPGWKQEVLFDVVQDPGETLDLKALDPDRTLLDDFAAVVDAQMAASIPDLPRFGSADR